MPEYESPLVRWFEEKRRKEELKNLSSEDDSDPYSLSSSEDKGLEVTYTENMDRLLEMHVKQRVDVELLLKKKIKRKFQLNDVQINQGLFDAIRRKHSPVGRGASIRRRRSVR